MKLNKKYGIINFHNNCYLNVIIQLFLYNKSTSNIIIYYLDIINNEEKIFNPEKLIKLLSKKINVNKQNDSHETFTLILDLIPELEKYYENKISNYYKCQECTKCRIKEDKFSTFYIYNSSLEESIKELLIKEQFELECDNCKKKTLTIKKCKINQLGEVLIFYNVQKKKLKITENITFGNSKYKLTGLIKHFGSQNSGHYVFIDYINKLIIDDTKIIPIQNIEMDNIYLVFYTC